MGPEERSQRLGNSEVHLLDLAQDLERADHDDAVAIAFQEFIQKAGFTSFSCRRFQPAATVNPDSILLSTTPQAWRDLYQERGWGLHDPILQELRSRCCSLVWSEVLRGHSLTPPQQELMREAAANGLVDGFGISIHEAGGYVGTVNLAAASVRLDPAGRATLALASAYLYQRLCALRAAAQRCGGKRLSPREIEILHWITEGKSDWQIGRILAISDKTVNYHIENVKRKFGVATRVQAVVSAIQQGSLSY
jgi:LuxR family quorum sensing-dependent transcriptional regulator